MQHAQSPAARGYRSAPIPESSLPWREASFSVIDLETTGFDRSSDEIISFASVAVDEGRVKPGETKYHLIRPRHMPGPETIRIHGLRESDLAKAPSLPDRLDEILEALTGTALVAHVAAVETGFLGEALSQAGLELQNPVIDTAGLVLELRRLRGQPPPRRAPVGLSDLARSLQLPVHRPHHADGDALTTAQAFLALATHLDAYEPQTVGTLERLSRPRPDGVPPALRRIARALHLGRR